MKTLKLDLHKWRCGDFSDNSLGCGETELLNNEGYMCCLGQFALQAGHAKDQILNNSEPMDISCLLKGVIKNDAFCMQAIDINDDRNTSASEKISSLTKLCKKHGYNLIVKNDSAFRSDGSVNWKFVADTVILCASEIEELSSHKIEKLNKYCRQAIRKVGKKRFVRNVLKYKERYEEPF